MTVLKFPKVKPGPIKAGRRVRRVPVLLSNEEKNILENLARAEGVSNSDYMRRLLRDAYRRGPR
jgi:hypothetical protein